MLSAQREDKCVFGNIYFVNLKEGLISVIEITEDGPTFLFFLPLVFKAADSTCTDVYFVY